MEGRRMSVGKLVSNLSHRKDARWATLARDRRICMFRLETAGLAILARFGSAANAG
jgi:hypothetical protein